MHYGKTQIVVSNDEHSLGDASANAFKDAVTTTLAGKDEINVVFAAGESQTTFFASLAALPEIAWERIICINMDDFWCPDMPEEYTCGYQAKTQLYDKVGPKEFHLVDFAASDAQAEAERFECLLRNIGEIDITCQGIGTSGHLALNEPGATRFDDKRLVRVVDIAGQSKKQLIADPNFRELGFIPDKGITMTIPALMSATQIFTIVPLALKKEIVTKVLAAPEATEELPATILRNYAGTLFLDRNSCPDMLLADR